MKSLKLHMPAVATDNATAASSRPLIRITAAAGTALLVLVLASPHLAAQVVEVPVAVPAVNALTESAAEAGTTKIVTRDFD